MSITMPRSVRLPSQYVANSLTVEEAELIAEEIQRLGQPTPHEVVDAARDEDSALHKHFTWDDSEAAEYWRLTQARQLIRAVKVRIIGAEGQPVVVRAFHLLPGEDQEEEQRYVHVEVVRQSPHQSAHVMARAKSEVQKWYQQYIGYRSVLLASDGRFDAVFRAIEEISDEDDEEES